MLRRGQLRPRRVLHARRVRRVRPARPSSGVQLLGGAARSCRWRSALLGMRAGAAADPPADRARPAVQLPAHLRAHADPAGPGEAASTASQSSPYPTPAGAGRLGRPRAVRLSRRTRCSCWSSRSWSASAVWWLLTRTRVGMVVRAATERPELTRALGIDVGPLGDAGVRLRHRAGRAGRGAGRADAGGQPADGRRPHHRGLRGRGDRRARLDLRLGGRRLRASGCCRRWATCTCPALSPDAGVRPDGRRAAVAAGRPVRPRGGACA